MLSPPASLSVTDSYCDAVVVELSQTPEDDSHRRWRCACRADELVTVGAYLIH